MFFPSCPYISICYFFCKYLGIKCFSRHQTAFKPQRVRGKSLAVLTKWLKKNELYISKWQRPKVNRNYVLWEGAPIKSEVRDPPDDIPLCPVLTSEQPGHSASGISCSTSSRQLQSIHIVSLAVPRESQLSQPSLNFTLNKNWHTDRPTYNSKTTFERKDREDGMQLHTYALTRKAFQVSNS